MTSATSCERRPGFGVVQPEAAHRRLERHRPFGPATPRNRAHEMRLAHLGLSVRRGCERRHHAGDAERAGSRVALAPAFGDDVDDDTAAALLPLCAGAGADPRVSSAISGRRLERCADRPTERLGEQAAERNERRERRDASRRRRRRRRRARTAGRACRNPRGASRTRRSTRKPEAIAWIRHGRAQRSGSPGRRRTSDRGSAPTPTASVGRAGCRRPECPAFCIAARSAASHARRRRGR